MKIKELIEELKKCSPESEVYYNDDKMNGSLDNRSFSEVIKISDEEVRLV